MEKNSINSRAQKSLMQAPSPSPSQESGWSMYIADFIATQPREEEEEEEEEQGSAGYHGRPSGVAGSASMASDAASGAPWNSRGFKKLRFGRMKARDHRAALDDDDLEDTASSPVNSPKVSDLQFGSELMEAKMKSADGKQIIYKEEGDNIIHGNLKSRDKLKMNSELAEMRLSDHHQHTHYQKRSYDLTELRKRGLCLVPTSMFINYLE